MSLVIDGIEREIKQALERLEYLKAKLEDEKKNAVPYYNSGDEIKPEDRSAERNKRRKMRKKLK